MLLRVKSSKFFVSECKLPEGVLQVGNYRKLTKVRMMWDVLHTVILFYDDDRYDIMIICCYLFILQVRAKIQWVHRMDFIIKLVDTSDEMVMIT